MLTKLQFEWAPCRLPQNGCIVNAVVLLSEMSISCTPLFLDCHDFKKQCILKRNNFLLVMDRIFQKGFGDLPWKNGRSLSETEDYYGSKQARLVWGQVLLCVRTWRYTSKQARPMWLCARFFGCTLFLWAIRTVMLWCFFIQFQVLSSISKSLLLFLSLQSSVPDSCNPVLMEFWTSKWERELSNGNLVAASSQGNIVSEPQVVSR